MDGWLATSMYAVLRHCNSLAGCCCAGDAAAQPHAVADAASSSLSNSTADEMQRFVDGLLSQVTGATQKVGSSKTASHSAAVGAEERTEAAAPAAAASKAGAQPPLAASGAASGLLQGSAVAAEGCSKAPHPKVGRAPAVIVADK
jgi:hypothetical protein